MHRIAIPQSVIDDVVRHRGRAHVFDVLEGSRTALIVVDMQNGFMVDAIGHSVCATAREIVPNVNRIAAALREAGGTVVWIKNTVTPETRASWSVRDEMEGKARSDKREKSMAPGSEGHALWPELDARPEDPVVQKMRFSAFIQGSSNLEALLRGRGIDTVIITGTVTNVCCESTARDAMMRNFRTIMVTDGNAAFTDEQHNASLAAFYLKFGDILSTDEVIAALAAKAHSTAAE
jgi:ureidoacrylate peracid hydrolase